MRADLFDRHERREYWRGTGNHVTRDILLPCLATPGHGVDSFVRQAARVEPRVARSRESLLRTHADDAGDIGRSRGGVCGSPREADGQHVVTLSWPGLRSGRRTVEVAR